MPTGLTLRTVLLKILRERQDAAAAYDAMDALTNLYSLTDPDPSGNTPVSIDDITRAGIRIHITAEE